MKRDVYPFLSEIPDNILAKIDLSVLYDPSSDEFDLICRLANVLEKHIVIYKKNHVSSGIHLCRVLRPAELTKIQLEALNLVEKNLDGQVIVAYEKPLTIASEETY